MISVDAEADFLDCAYEAAIEPALWEPLLVRYSDLLSGADANLIFQDQVTGEGRALSARGDPAAFPLFFGHFATRNPLLKINDLPMGLRVVTDEDKLPKGELKRTEYYNDFMRRFDLHSVMVTRVALEESNSVCLNITRPANREPFGKREIETANRLLPHLVRSFRLATKLSGMEPWRDSLEDFLDRSIHSVFVVDAKAALRRANRAGESLLASRSGLTLHGGVLRAQHADATRKLHALIALAGNADKERRKGADMALARPERGRPLSITVAPVRSERLSLFDSGPSVLVCVSDPDADVAIPERRLRDLFGLSRAEARVALQLLDGRDPREAAEKLGLSFYTVRGHLVRMFDKTGTGRQSELIRLMMRAIGHISI